MLLRYSHKRMIDVIVKKNTIDNRELRVIKYTLMCKNA